MISGNMNEQITSPYAGQVRVPTACAVSRVRPLNDAVLQHPPRLQISLSHAYCRPRCTHSMNGTMLCHIYLHIAIHFPPRGMTVAGGPPICGPVQLGGDGAAVHGALEDVRPPNPLAHVGVRDVEHLSRGVGYRRLAWAILSEREGDYVGFVGYRVREG